MDGPGVCGQSSGEENLLMVLFPGNFQERDTFGGEHFDKALGSRLPPSNESG